MLLMAHGFEKVNVIGVGIAVKEIPLAETNRTARFSNGSRKALGIAQTANIRTTCKAVFHFLNTQAK